MITLAEYKTLMERPAKKPRYRNRKTEVDGVIFDSKKEAKRWNDLKIMQKKGEISALERQPKYSIEHNGVKICKVRPDFFYLQNGEAVIEDVKSPATRKDPVYRIKFKLLQAFHNITISEV